MTTTEPNTLPDALAAKIAALPFKVTLIHQAATPKDGPDRWTCTLAGQDFPYSKGVYLRVYKRPNRALFIPRSETLNLKNPRTVAEVEAWPHCTAPVDPTAPELLADLASGAALYEECRNLDDFAANYGDPGKVSETVENWEACARANRLLRRWFTPPELKALREWAREL